MMTIQQASIAVGRQIGLAADFDGSVAAINALDPDTQQAFTAGLGAYIRAHQDQFTPAQVTTANAMAGLTGQPLADAGFSVSDFVAASLDNGKALVLDPLVNIGQSASAVANALPLLAIIVGAVLLIAWTKSKSAAIAAP